MKRSFLFFLSLIVVGRLSGQSSDGLLWEVTHPELPGPSYVFGTMHVNEAPVFELGDSVWHAILSSDVFAMEVSLDSIRDYACVNIHDNETEELFRSPFPEERGRSKDGGPHIPIKLDQYLLLIAKDAGKRIDGLEPIRGRDREFVQIQDQQSVDGWTAVVSYRRLLNAYISGDLDAVEAQFAEHIDSHLIRRNHLMVESIRRIAAHEQLFAAVGVGHLIGDNGIPALLRADGYTVRPMQAGTVTKPFAFSLLESLDEDWISVGESNPGYSIQMPGEPCSYYTDEGVSMRIYLDAVTEQIYGVGILPHDITMRTKDFRKVIGELITSQTPEGSKPSVRNFSYAGIKGLEVHAMIGDYEVTYRYLMRNGIIYVIMFGNEIGFRWAHLRDKFLNSLVFSTPDHTWRDFVHEEGAYTVHFPGEPQYVPVFFEEEIEGMLARYEIHVHYAVDPKSKAQYLVRYNDMPPGTFAETDSVMAEESIQILDEHLGTTRLLASRKESFHGYLSVWRSVISAGGGYAEYQFIMRGNRSYLLLLQATSAKDVNPMFIESFDFIDFRPSHLEKTALNDGEFSVLFTDDMYVEMDSSYYDSEYMMEKVDVFTARDNTNGAVILVERLMTSPYDIPETSDSLEREFQYAIVDSAEIRSIEEITMSGYPGWRINGRDGKNNLDVMYQYFRLGHYMYGVRVLFPIEIDGVTYADSILNSFVLHREPELFADIPKGTLLLQHLSAQDTIVHAKAAVSIPDVKFTKAEQPLLEKAILRDWPDDTLDNGIKSRLLEAYVLLMQAESIPFVRAFLADTMIAKPFVAGALSGLAASGDSVALEYFFQIMDSPHLVREEIYWGGVLTPFEDSAQMVMTWFDRLMPYAEDLDIGDDIIRLFTSAHSDSTADLTSHISDHADTFLNILTFQSDSLARTSDTLWQRYQIVYRISNLIDLLAPTIGIDPIEPFLRRFAENESGYLRRDCVLQLLKGGLQVHDTLLQTVLADTLNAPYFVFRLVEDSLLHRIPGHLYQEEQIARFDIERLLSEEYHSFELEPFGTRTIPYRDQDVRIYLYKLRFDDEDGEYLAISGPFPVIPHSEYYNILTDYSFTELTPGNLDAVVEEILAWYSEE